MNKIKQYCPFCQGWYSKNHYHFKQIRQEMKTKLKQYLEKEKQKEVK